MLTRRCYKLSRELGVELSVDQLIQAHTVFREQAEHYGDKPILVVGGKGNSCREVAHSYGFKKVFTPQDLLSWRPELWPFKKLSKGERESVHVSHDNLCHPVDFKSDYIGVDGRLLASPVQRGIRLSRFERLGF